MRRVGTVLDRRFLRHVPAEDHPENPGRLEAIQGLLAKPAYRKRLASLPARAALLRDMTRVHTREHLDRLGATAGALKPVFTDPDTYVCGQSWEAARYAAGSTVAAVDAVLADELDTAFVFPRPPGHHAEADRTSGFCMVNNVAIAAAHAVAEKGIERVLVLDWDLHHGNGTQHIFENRRDVLYMSLHQFPFFPGTGAATEVGIGEGRGFNVNVPLPAGRGDRDYLAVFRELFLPIARQYSPELVLISAGYDPYYLDPIGGMKVTADGFAEMAAMVLELAEETSGGRSLFVLEGGYHLEGLRDCVRSVLDVAMGERRALHPGEPPSAEGRAAIERARRIQDEYWKF